MFPSAKFAGSLAVAIGLSTGIALAQTAPARPAGPSAAFPLQLAYRAIGAAEARGAGGHYLDAARTHYRSALARLARSDNAGAAREAGASAALARAATDEHPIPAPRDLPAPPAMPAAVAGAPRMGRRMPMGGGMGGPRPGGPGGPGGMAMHRPPMRHGHGGMRGRFDPASLARYAKVENTPEATDLAKNAMDADQARSRALFAGNRGDAMRQGRISHDLSTAVRMLAYADHPEAFPRPMRRPMNGRGPGFRRPATPGGTTGTVGFTGPASDEDGGQP